MRDYIVNLFYPSKRHHHSHHEDILMKLSELANSVVEISAQLSKAQDEILSRITALEDTLGDVDLPEAALNALNDLRSKAKALDDVVPDAILELDIPE